MRTIFADACYWIAIANPGDALRTKARTVSESLGRVRLETTDEVLVEFLAFFCPRGPELRARAVEMVRKILKDPNIRVCPQTHDSFLTGLQLYGDRPDKAYSLTDCISMNVMHRDSIAQVLTHDQHFVQEGFQALLRD